MDGRDRNSRRRTRRGATVVAAALMTGALVGGTASLAGAAGNPSNPPASPQSSAPRAADAALPPGLACPAVYTSNPNADASTYRNSQVGSAIFYELGLTLCGS